MKRISSYGVLGDGNKDETRLIQRAIDDCAKMLRVLNFDLCCKAMWLLSSDEVHPNIYGVQQITERLTKCIRVFL